MYTRINSREKIGLLAIFVSSQKKNGVFDNWVLITMAKSLWVIFNSLYRFLLIACVYTPTLTSGGRPIV